MSALWKLSAIFWLFFLAVDLLVIFAGLPMYRVTPADVAIEDALVTVLCILLATRSEP